MKRIILPQCTMNPETLLEMGFDYYNLPSSDGSPYFTGDVCYIFSEKEIDRIEHATNELHYMCLDFVDDEVKKGDYQYYKFTPLQKQLIEDSWKREDMHFYGRFDFGYNDNSLKLFEYNADTPTSLLESSVVQWRWLENMKQIVMDYHFADQFNSIHEEMIERLKKFKQKYKTNHIHIVGMEEAGREDWGNLDYLCDVAFEADFKVISQLAVEEIGWDSKKHQFVNLNNENIDLVFKLYPLEWLTTSDFAQYVPHCQTQFIEPMWKLLLSNKILMAKLWERYPNHENLIPSYMKEPSAGQFVKKPLLGREGANISYLDFDNHSQQRANGSEFSDLYNQHGFMYQELFEMKNYSEQQPMYPVIGSWVVGNKSCGINIREDFTPVTGNDSHFIPHIMLD